MKHLESYEVYESLASSPIFKLFGFLRKLGKKGYEILRKKIYSDKSPITWHGPLPKGRIRASDAYTTKGSILTVLTGRRGVGYLTTLDNEPRLRKTIQQGIERGTIKKMDISVKDLKDNPYKPFIIYRPEFEKEALELKEIAERFNGYLSYEADKLTSKRIGELLGYADEDILQYLD